MFSKQNLKTAMFVLSVLLIGAGAILTVVATVGAIVGIGGIIFAPKSAYGWLLVVGIPPIGFGIILVVIGRAMMKSSKT
mgnify:CR=1 FL=1